MKKKLYAFVLFVSLALGALAPSGLVAAPDTEAEAKAAAAAAIVILKTTPRPPRPAVRSPESCSTMHDTPLPEPWSIFGR